MDGMENQSAKLYDLKELKIISAGDMVFYHEMIHLFISQNETALLELTRYIATRDFNKVKNVLHKMKPSVMVMGVVGLTKLIARIEDLMLPGTGEAEFDALFYELKTVVLEVNAGLRLI